MRYDHLYICMGNEFKGSLLRAANSEPMKAYSVARIPIKVSIKQKVSIKSPYILMVGINKI